MIYNEAFDFLFAQMAAPQDRDAVKRKKDYERKRLCRAMLARALKPYWLQLSWVNTTGAAGEETVANSKPLLQPLIVIGGAIRTTDITATGSADNNNFEISLFRTGGNSRVQLMSTPIKDEHLLTPAQEAIREVIIDAILGQGQSWPNYWPVPLGLLPNELVQVRAKVLAGGVPAGNTTFIQLQAIMADNKPGSDIAEAELRAWIASNPIQRPVYLSMFTEGFHSIAYPDTGANQRTTAKTRETDAPILITGYSTLFARATAGENGSACDPKWRLSASNGWTFSTDEIDVNCYEYAGPGYFYRELPVPFLLPKGGSLSAAFSTRGSITTQLERIENYVIFRGVTV